MADPAYKNVERKQFDQINNDSDLGMEISPSKETVRRVFSRAREHWTRKRGRFCKPCSRSTHMFTNGSA